MKITEVYEKYKIMPNLQRHQLKVAGVAKAICDSMIIPIDADSVIKAALLHDMGNIIKYRFDHAKEIFGFTDEEIEHAKNLQKEFVEKYGKDEHVANCEIAKELNTTEKVQSLVNDNHFKYLCVHKDSNDIEMKILHYADTRVSPKGIVSFNERMSEAQERYKEYPNRASDDEVYKLLDCGREIESQIFSNSKINREDINNEVVFGYIEELKNYEI